GAPPAVTPARPPERLARLVARALTNPAFRAYLKAQLDASPYRERKLQFQTFVRAAHDRALRQIAEASGEAEDALARDVGSAIALEIYLPVPEHRAAWTGDDQVLVATALTDRDAPIAFDVNGRRRLLDPDGPPATPVIALVPVETDFTAGPELLLQCESCLDYDGGDGVSGGTPTTTPPPGLYMTKAHFTQDFESWLKGSPEFETHLLGQRGQTDSLVTYQCAGEHAGGPYAYNQNGTDWTGRVLLFSKRQFDDYNAAHPGRNLRVFFVEDDDTACSIRTDPDRFQKIIFQVDSLYQRLTAGNDSSTAIVKAFKYAKAAYNVWQALANWIKSNDELIGNAVEDDIVKQVYPGYNWFVKGENTITNGWVNLVMY
ncbi:MAG: hypothetical protein ACREMN_07165, partial [Gemmatimonadales bacterium]